MSRLRTFLGIDLGKTQKDRCVLLQEQLSLAGTPVNWVERANLHVTLLFLGEIDNRDIPTVCQVVKTEAANHAPFEMELQGVGGFPSTNRPKSIHVKVGLGTEVLCSLYANLELKLLEVVRYRRENRPYVPHVTLGRPRRDEEESALSQLLLEKDNWDGGTFRVQQVQVLSSQLFSSGPVYSVLSRCRLG